MSPTIQATPATNISKALHSELGKADAVLRLQLGSSKGLAQRARGTASLEAFTRSTQQKVRRVPSDLANTPCWASSFFFSPSMRQFLSLASFIYVDLIHWWMRKAYNIWKAHFRYRCTYSTELQRCSLKLLLHCTRTREKSVPLNSSKFRLERRKYFFQIRCNWTLELIMTGCCWGYGLTRA